MEKQPDALMQSQHLGYLDGLRAMAALWVVLYHTHLLIFSYQEIPWYLSLLGWIRHGHSAVGLFIVISGFCLTIPVAKRKRLSPDVAVFFKRRAIRILPPLYATLVLGIASQLVLKLLTKHSLIDPISILNSILLIQDLAPSRIYPAQWLWSVDLEFKLYLVFPMLVGVLLKQGPQKLLLMAIILGIGLTLVYWKFLTGFAWELASPWYIVLFTFGILACWACFSNDPTKLNKHALIGSLGCLVIVVFYCSAIPKNDLLYLRLLPLNDVCIGGLGAFLIILLSQKIPRPLFDLLESKPLVFLGQRSYSIYLIHVLVIQNFQILYRKQHFLRIDLIAGTICIGIILALASLFYVIIEKPCLDLLAKLKRA